MHQPENVEAPRARKPYSAPKVEPKGRVEDVTRWSAPFALFIDPVVGWNRWAQPGGGS